MILSYDTVKYVSIQDSRLGVLRYLLMLLILLYVGYIEMYANGGYLFSDTIHGVLRFTVQQPTIHNCDPFNENSLFSCENNFRPLQELSYCQQQNSSSILFNHSNDDNHNNGTNDDDSTNDDDIDDYHGNIYPCQYYEAINAQIITETSVTIITRGKVLNQTFICGGGNENDDNVWNNSRSANSISTGSTNEITCPHTYQTILPPSFPFITNTNTNTTNTTTTIIPFYVAQSEAFTILIDHAVTATKLCRMSSSAVTSSSLSYACSSTSSQHHESTTGSKSRSYQMKFFCLLSPKRTGGPTETPKLVCTVFIFCHVIFFVSSFWETNFAMEGDRETSTFKVRVSRLHQYPKILEFNRIQ